MKAITLRLEPDTIESLDNEASEHGVTRSEYIRDIIDRRSEYDEIDRLRTELERVKNERDTLIQERQDTTAIVEYVEEEREREQRRRERQEAPVWKRAKWWILGTPDGSDDARA
jgi:predicted DNA-binding protein